MDGHHLRRLLSPRSIAVVGATERPGYAARLFQNLVGGGFEGELYPVSLTRDTVFGRRAYPTVTDLPGPVDVVMIAVPAPHVPEVVRACGRHDVGAAVVISAGFSEAGDEGRALADELRRAARDAGQRLAGELAVPQGQKVAEQIEDSRAEEARAPTGGSTPDRGAADEGEDDLDRLLEQVGRP